MAWKTHPTYTNYEVGTGGKIRNKTTKKILKPKLRWDGYSEYTLMKDGKKHYVKGHRAAAEAKSGKKLSSKDIVNHKNGDRKSNGTKNLQVTTSSENNKKSNKQTKKKYQNNSKTRKWSSKKSK
jgi:hypothetical protein